MNVTTDLSLITLIVNASLLVKLVLRVLLAMSLMSWWYIFRKSFVLREHAAQVRGLRAHLLERLRSEPLFQSIVSSRRAGRRAWSASSRPAFASS